MGRRRDFLQNKGQYSQNDNKNLLCLCCAVGPVAFLLIIVNRALPASSPVFLVFKKEASMPLIQVVFVLIVIGVLLWLANRFIPMEGTIKNIMNAVVVIVVVIWLISLFFNIGSLSSIKFPSVRG